MVGIQQEGRPSSARATFAELGDGGAEAQPPRGPDDGGLNHGTHLQIVAKSSLGGAAPANVGVCGARLAVWRPRLRAFLDDYLLWGHIGFLIAGVGYIPVDFARGFVASHVNFTSAMYIILAWFFLFDAVVYYALWQGSKKPPSLWARLGDSMNILGSLGYSVTSIMYLYEGTAAMITAVMWIEGLMTVCFVISAFAYWLDWLASDPRAIMRACNFLDLELWTHLLNIAPAVLYLLASCAAMWYHYDLLANHSSLTTGPLVGSTTGEAKALVFLSKFTVWGDVGYAADAVVCLIHWSREAITVNRKKKPLSSPSGKDDMLTPLSTTTVNGAGEGEADGESSDSDVDVDDVTQGYQVFCCCGAACKALWSRGMPCCYMRRKRAPRLPVPAATVSLNAS